MPGYLSYLVYMPGLPTLVGWHARVTHVGREACRGSLGVHKVVYARVTHGGREVCAGLPTVVGRYVHRCNLSGWGMCTVVTSRDGGLCPVLASRDGRFVSRSSLSGWENYHRFEQKCAELSPF